MLIHRFNMNDNDMEVLYGIRTRHRHRGQAGCGKNLRQARVGETVTVLKVGGCGALRKRLMEMGITKGAQISVKKIAPLGDPIQISVRGYELSLRKNEAANVFTD
jgi:ferrous iron transport protein A